MTYCVGMRLKRGLIFMSDTRTNAGVDNISVFRKMFTWSVPGERVITLMTAGNLATTQALISLLDERSKVPDDRDPSILVAPTMFQIATLIGETLRELVRNQVAGAPKSEAKFGATLILGGQITGMEPRLFMIYPEGNFIEASEDTPFFQIGETKYGRPILLRAYDEDLSFEDAAKLLILSFDSTLKANLSVGMPLDLQIYEADSLDVGLERRIEQGDAYFNEISSGWSEALREAFHSLPNFEF